MSEHIRWAMDTTHFMAGDMCLREVFGPMKGDTLNYAGEDWTIEKCYIVESMAKGMFDYRIVATNENRGLRVVVPVEDMTNNGWSWFVGKFSFELDIQEEPGLFHVVDPFFQNTFDVRAPDEAHAVAKAQTVFSSDSPYLLVHKIYRVSAVPSASKIISQLNRAIKAVPYGKGPLSDCINHPDPISTMSPKSTADLNRFQKDIENLFHDFTGGTTWSTLGEGRMFSTDDFQIIELCAETDGAV